MVFSCVTFNWIKIETVIKKSFYFYSITIGKREKTKIGVSGKKINFQQQHVCIQDFIFLLMLIGISLIISNVPKARNKKCNTIKIKILVSF
jgi:hypothetical protein